METFTFIGDLAAQSDAGHRVFLAAFTELPREQQDAIHAAMRERKGAFDIEFAVNGVPLSFVSFMQNVQRAWDRAVDEAAAKLIVAKATELQRKVDGLRRVLNDVVGEVREAVVAEFPNVDLSDDEDR